jgi:hypothetical protein
MRYTLISDADQQWRQVSKGNTVGGWLFGREVFPMLDAEGPH